jgi:putative glutamine amidotransferase
LNWRRKAVPGIGGLLSSVIFPPAALAAAYLTMPKLATWIRAKDEPVFAPWFAAQPELEVPNARLLPAASAGDDVLPPDADGLLLTGGPDISAEFLHQPIPNPALIEDAQPERDRWEFAALGAALARRLPIFAICKGHQILNVALGGTLYLDIPGHENPELRDGDLQALRYAAEAPLEPRFACVNSSHHQAIDRLGDGLEVEAWSAGDGIIEQVRLRGYPYALGVQYHPERGAVYAPLFEAFFARLYESAAVRIR